MHAEAIKLAVALLGDHQIYRRPSTVSFSFVSVAAAEALGEVFVE